MVMSQCANQQCKAYTLVKSIKLTFCHCSKFVWRFHQRVRNPISDFQKIDKEAIEQRFENTFFDFYNLWYGFNHAFLRLKSRNNTNAARGNTITSTITSWLYGDEKYKKIRNFMFRSLEIVFQHVESQRVGEIPPGSSSQPTLLLTQTRF